MFVWLWLGAGALLNYLAQRILLIRGPLTRKLRLATGALSFALTGVLFWWLFDVPGYIRLQQAIAKWDTSEPLPDYRPIVELNGRTLVLAAGAGLLALGLVMLIRPEIYLRDVPEDIVLFGTARPKPVSLDGTLKRFRIYGVVIMAGGLVALWAGAVAW